MASLGQLDHTPIGTIRVAATNKGLVAVSLWDDGVGGADFADEVARLTGESPDMTEQAPLVKSALDQLADYLSGVLRAFDLPIDWAIMSPFQRTALEHVCTVSYGQITTYQSIADRMGKPGAARAVGRANATNPMPIVIPCHRVLGSDGKLHGYGARGGLETKAWLLRLEGSWLI